MKFIAVVIANGFSSEVRAFANILAERDNTYEPLVLCHVQRNPHSKDRGSADEFEGMTKAPMFRFDAGWRRNDDGQRSKIAKVGSWATLHLQLPRLLAVARRHRPDVIYSSQQRWDSHLATVLARALGVHQVMHLHYTVEPSLGPEVLRRLRAVSGLVCVSEYIRRQAVESGVAEGRTLVLPNAMHPLPAAASGGRATLRRAFGIADDAPVFSFVARLVERKGQVDAIQAFSRVVREVPSAHLLIAGDGPLGGVLEKLVQELSLVERVKLLGYRRDVPALLAASDAFVHPSRKEPFGLSILEAMAAGLPTIAYREGGPVEVIREGGFLVPSGDVTGLGDAMLRLIRDRDLRARMGRIARQDVETRFNPRIEAMRFASFLNSVCSTHPVRYRD